MSRRLAVTSAIALALLGGCGGSGNDTGAPVSSDSEPSVAATTAVLTTSAPTSTDVDTQSTAASATPSTATPTTAAPSPPSTGVIPGVAVMTLLTAGPGLGARPILRWDAVTGAASYVVSVNAPSGGPLWAWEGPGTEVAFGGGPADDPDTTGAQLHGPATWFVAALDADHRVIATSPRADLAP